MAMRLLLLAGAVGASILGLSGCGYVSAGPSETEGRSLPDDVSAVELEGTGTLTVAPGDPALSITAGRNTLDRISSTAQDGALQLAVDDGFLNSPGPIEYALTLPRVDAVNIAGSGAVVGGLSPTDSLTVRIDGSGDIRLTDVDAEQVTVVISGAGSVELAGSTQHLDVLVEGSGEFTGTQLRAGTAVADIEGAGEITVNASERLDASISGSGTITHSGGADVTEHIDGSGEITVRR